MTADATTTPKYFLSNFLSVNCCFLLYFLTFASLCTSSAVGHTITDTGVDGYHHQQHPQYTVAVTRQPHQQSNDDRLLHGTLLTVNGDEAQPLDHKQHPHEDVESLPQRLRRSNERYSASDFKHSGDQEDDEEGQEGVRDSHTRAQHFFPSFAPLFPAPPPPPLGHSRPTYYNQESAYSHRPTFPGGFRDLSYPHAVAESESNTNVLGSGNFGVLRGGTFFAEERDDVLSDDLYSSYYHGGNNGHGRPSFYHRNPQPNYRQGDDFFANFRDFADISTPTKSSYSQYYVVYARQNATNREQQRPKLMGSDDNNSDDVDEDNDDYAKQTSNTYLTQRRNRQRPQNIIEQLSLIDSISHLETPEENENNDKLSKRKTKLLKYKKHLERKENRKTTKKTVSPKELYEPLLALS